MAGVRSTWHREVRRERYGGSGGTVLGGSGGHSARGSGEYGTGSLGGHSKGGSGELGSQEGIGTAGTGGYSIWGIRRTGVSGEHNTGESGRQGVQESIILGCQEVWGARWVWYLRVRREWYCGVRGAGRLGIRRAWCWDIRRAGVLGRHRLFLMQSGAGKVQWLGSLPATLSHLSTWHPWIGEEGWRW